LSFIKHEVGAAWNWAKHHPISAVVDAGLVITWGAVILLPN
jgi:hypothetical protein